MNNQLPQLILGDVIVPVPVIQGGMGVGVSRSRLAGAVAKEGGIGVISTAQIGYDEENFEKNPAECNRRAIIKHIAQAKEIAGGNGLVGVNIMVALKHYRQHIETAVEAADLPGIAQNYAREHGKKIPKLMPIVSSARAAGIILKMWDHHYHTVPDCIIVEGPMADDTIYNYLQNYLDGKISRSAFWELVKFKYPTHQISFHTINALRCLEFERSEPIYDRETER
mgnify:CR=1 FL=1